MLDSHRAFVVHGAHGVDELSPAGPNLVFEVVDGDVHERLVDPEELGIPRCDPSELDGGTPQENAQTAREVLGGTPGPKRDAVVLNAAGAIAAAGHAPDLARRPGARARGHRQRRRDGTPRRARRVLATILVMGRFADALARPGLTAIAEVKRRSPSAGDLDPMPIPPRSPPRTSGPGRLRSRSSSTSASAARGTTCARRAARLRSRCSRRASSSTERLAYSARSRCRCGASADARPRRRRGDATPRGRLRPRLETLVEAHDARELDRAVALGAPVIGINARDLATFEIDRTEQLRLVASAPRDRVVIAESGIESRAQGAAAELAGADAILVGSTLMRAPDPAAKLEELVSRPLVKVCGLTREEDVAAAVEAGADMAGFVLADASPRRAPGILPVPDTVLAVAVVVGEPEGDGADLVQLYAAEDGKVRGRDAVLLREGEEVARVVDLPWQEADPTHLERARSDRRARDARRRARPRERPRRDRGRSTVGGRRELEPRGVARSQGSRAHSRVRGGCPVTATTYGAYGGRYVPETLIPALDELERGWKAATRGSGVPFRAGRSRRALCGPAVAALRDGAIRACPTAGSSSSARTSTTRAPTRSTTRSARSSSRRDSASGESLPRPAPGSTASRRRPCARGSGSSASSTWERRTCAGSTRTSSACACSAPRSARSSSAQGR